MIENMLANNINKIEISGIRRFYNEVTRVPEALSLTLGQPDFPVPEAVKDAMVLSIISNRTGYTENAGIKSLRDEISLFLEREYKICYNRDEICITVGGSEGIFSALGSIINPGDIVLLPSIAYPAYESCATLLGGRVQYYKLKEDFTPDPESLKEILEKGGVKAVVFSHPSNPTGAVLTKAAKEELYSLLKNEQCFIISDEIYSSIIYEEEYHSIAQYEDLKERIILVGGFSKIFSMTGLRVGYVCAEKKVISAITKLHQYNVSCAPSIAQYGALEGLRSCIPEVKHRREEFRKRRDYSSKRLKDMGLDVNIPGGAFYLFPSIKRYSSCSEDFCKKLLYEGKVAVVPGSAFGRDGEGHIRLSYCYSIEELKNCLDRMENWLEKAFNSI